MDSLRCPLPTLRIISTLQYLSDIRRWYEVTKEGQGGQGVNFCAVKRSRVILQCGQVVKQ